MSTPSASGSVRSTPTSHCAPSLACEGACRRPSSAQSATANDWQKPTGRSSRGHVTRVLFDIGRIFIRGSRFSPTGIDRVVVAYARWLLDQPDIELQPVLTFGGRLLGVPRRMLERTIRQNEAFGRQRNDSDVPGEAWG